MATAPTSRLENLRSLRAANLDGSFATAFTTLVSGAFLVGFIKELGGSDLWIGLLSAIPNLLGLLQVPGAILGRGYPSYKRYVQLGGGLWRVCYLPVVFLPLLPWDNQLRLALLALFVGLGWVGNLIVAPSYSEWLGEMVPPTSRGFFFSRRNARMVAVGATVGILGGAILDAFRRAGNEPVGFASVFGLGMVCAVVSMLLFNQMHDLQRSNSVKQTLRQGLTALREPFADRSFQRVLVFIAVFVFGQMFAGNLFSAFAIESLGLPFTIIQLFVLTHAAGNVLSAPLWGYLADKYGNKPVLLLAGLGLTVTPVGWLFCVPGQDLRNTVILVISHVFIGAVWAGVTLCQFNLLFATSKSEDKATYIAAGMAVQAVMGGIAPLIGATTMELLRSYYPADIAYKWVFAGSMGVRLISAFFLAPVREMGAVQVRKTLQDLRRVTPRGYMAIRHLTRGDDERSRAEALQNLAAEQLTLATDEIIKALHDPSPRIRRQAATALARLRDPVAGEALIHQFVDHPDLVEEETVEAAGELGDQRAVPHLVRLLESPRSLIRRAAARALGRLNSEEAVAALAKAAGQSGDPDLRRASLQALRALGAHHMEVPIRDALFDPAPSVRIAAAEAIADLEIRSASPYLRQALEYFHDEASAEVAYALGVVGSLDDIPIILKEAARSVSMITRRRCLLGVAHLLGVERESYRLLLLEGMHRDNVVMGMLQAKSRRNGRLRAALERYSSGDEAGALRGLHSATRDPVFATFVEQPVSELFLVAITYLGHQRPDKT